MLQGQISNVCHKTLLSGCIACRAAGSRAWNGSLSAVRMTVCEGCVAVVVLVLYMRDANATICGAVELTKLSCTLHVEISI